MTQKTFEAEMGDIIFGDPTGGAEGSVFFCGFNTGKMYINEKIRLERTERKWFEPYISKMTHYISHETIHLVLVKIGGKETSLRFDMISNLPLKQDFEFVFEGGFGGGWTPKIMKRHFFLPYIRGKQEEIDRELKEIERGLKENVEGMAKKTKKLEKKIKQFKLELEKIEAFMEGNI